MISGRPDQILFVPTLNPLVFVLTTHGALSTLPLLLTWSMEY